MKLLLIIWSVAAFIWWLLALILLAQGCRRVNVLVRAARLPITVFKPLPPVANETERTALSKALGSFVSQLRSGDEMLIGLNENDAPGWLDKIQTWRDTWPAAQINVVTRDVPCQRANPKIAWMEVLAPLARGEIWLWSDVDVTAPPDFLEDLCIHLAESGDNAVTVPYFVEQVRHSHEILDALFVNVEFLPGTLLLGRLNRRDYAYGSATAFRAKTFLAKVDWHELGSALADDNKLGEMLQPVSLARTLVSTLPSPGGWLKAWQHYFRWHKTVRWCRPVGYASLLMLLPAFGWAAACLLTGGNVFYLTGLIAVLGGETLVAMGASRLVGCRLPPATWPGVLLWPLFRGATWLLVWLPIPVLWSGRKRKWFGPQQD